MFFVECFFLRYLKFLELYIFILKNRFEKNRRPSCFYVFWIWLRQPKWTSNFMLSMEQNKSKPKTKKQKKRKLRWVHKTGLQSKSNTKYKNSFVYFLGFLPKLGPIYRNEKIVIFLGIVNGNFWPDI